MAGNHLYVRADEKAVLVRALKSLEVGLLNGPQEENEIYTYDAIKRLSKKLGVGDAEG